MERWTTIVRIPVMALVLVSFNGCAIWFVPESQSRGHIFDDSVRGLIQHDERDARRRLDLMIHERFPPGTPLADVTGHIEDAGGRCASTNRTGTEPAKASTICTYESNNYFAWAYMGMGEPTYMLAENEWTVLIVHPGDAVQRYVIQSKAVLSHLSRDDYLEGLGHQRAEEELVRATD